MAYIYNIMYNMSLTLMRMRLQCTYYGFQAVAGARVRGVGIRI